MLVEQEAAPFESVEWAASFRKEITEREDLREVSDYGLLKAHLSKSLWDTCIGGKRTARDVLFQQLGYQDPPQEFPCRAISI